MDTMPFDDKVSSCDSEGLSILSTYNSLKNITMKIGKEFELSERKGREERKEGEEREEGLNQGSEGVRGFPSHFRFTFGPEFIDKLSRFAKVHQYDDRKTFKEAWVTWIKDDDISCLINDEFKHLRNVGFKGDIMDKMYKSARYYYRKKSDAPKEPRERKEYVGFSKDILIEMDANIEAQTAKQSTAIAPQSTAIASQSTSLAPQSTSLAPQSPSPQSLSPANAFANYCINYRHTIVSELTRENPEMSSWTRDEIEDMTNRFKKAYKNRFYTFQHSKRRP